MKKNAAKRAAQAKARLTKSILSKVEAACKKHGTMPAVGGPNDKGDEKFNADNQAFYVMADYSGLRSGGSGGVKTTVLTVEATDALRRQEPTLVPREVYEFALSHWKHHCASGPSTDVGRGTIAKNSQPDIKISGYVFYATAKDQLLFTMMTMPEYTSWCKQHLDV